MATADQAERHALLAQCSFESRCFVRGDACGSDGGGLIIHERLSVEYCGAWSIDNQVYKLMSVRVKRGGDRTSDRGNCRDDPLWLPAGFAQSNWIYPAF